MGDAIEGYHNWDVYFNEQRYIQVFDCKEIVFLVAESPNILTGKRARLQCIVTSYYTH